jgi:nicotinamidase-related amidase
MANLKFPDTPALILIDVQCAFDELEFFGGERNNPAAENNCSLLLQHWRKKGWPVFHVRHCSIQPGSPLAEGLPGNAFKAEVTPLPGEPVISKHVNSAFIGTDLRQRLDAQGIGTLVLAGLTTEHCVSTTTRMAGNFGFRVFVAGDATAAFRKTGLDGQPIPAETVWLISLATLDGEFATVVTTDEVCGDGAGEVSGN